MDDGDVGVGARGGEERSHVVGGGCCGWIGAAVKRGAGSEVCLTNVDEYESGSLALLLRLVANAFHGFVCSSRLMLPILNDY